MRVQRNKVQENIQPLMDYLIAHENQELSEAHLSNALGIEANIMRFVLTEVRYKMPVLHIKDKVYLYTTTNQELLKKEYDKMQAIIKQKCIKKNILKQYIKSEVA